MDVLYFNVEVQTPGLFVNSHKDVHFVIVIAYQGFVVNGFSDNVYQQ